MTQEKRKDQAAEVRARTPKGSNGKAWGRALPASLLRGVIGGDAGVQDAANYPSETPPPSTRG
jgi:hypothetical protein